MQNIIKIKRALISVSDKSFLKNILPCLTKYKIEIISSGGTYKKLNSLFENETHRIKKVEDITGFPEILGGRVKTLHPKIHGGLLGRRGTDDAIMTEHDIAPIDLVVVNLYPFQATLDKGADFATGIENIDIGGPAMVRAAAKNFVHVAVVTRPADYEAIGHSTRQAPGASLGPASPICPDDRTVLVQGDKYLELLSTHAKP